METPSLIKQESLYVPEPTLRFLLVSDIHLAYDNLERLLEWEESSKA